MDNQTREYITEKVKDLIAAPSCCAEAKAAGQAWLDAAGTENEAKASQALVEELELDIMPIDGLIGFAGSDKAVELMGEEVAKNLLAHAEEIKAQGAEYCDCPACTACAEILDKKEMLI